MKVSETVRLTKLEGVVKRSKLSDWSNLIVFVKVLETVPVVEFELVVKVSEKVGMAESKRVD